MITITIKIEENESGLHIDSRATGTDTGSSEEKEAMNAINTGAKIGFLKWVSEGKCQGTLIEHGSRTNE